MKGDFKNKTEKELQKRLADKRNKLREFRFQIAKGKIKNVKEASLLRKDVARILTEINKVRSKN